MKRYNILFLFLILATTNTMAQKNDTPLPYREIPTYPKKYSNVTVAARMIDGLGYRYYWATEGLTAQDLEYSPSSDARNAGETLDHIYGLSLMILNAPLQLPNVRPLEREALTFDEKRKKTLENFKQASDLLKESKAKDLKKFKIIFKRGDRVSEVPFWNMINGPIADAIYHTGQIASFRRSAGNPMDAGVNVFMGKTKE